MADLSLDSVRQLTLYKQHLTDDARSDDIVRIAHDIGGLHATEPATPYLSVFARTDSFTRERLDDELYRKRNLVKIRCMRKTLHVLTKEMVPVAYAATRRMVEENSRRFAEFRGVSSEGYETISKAITDVLEGREMSVFEIKKEIETRLNVPAILNLMCDRGLLARGRREKSWLNRNYKYALFREYLPDIDLAKMDETKAKKLLVQYYIGSFGPVTENDIAWWTGFSKKEVRETMANSQGEAIRVEVPYASSPSFILRSDLDIIRQMDRPKGQVVNLLPVLDPYLMGYKEREGYIDGESYNMVYDRSGNATSTILLDGRAVGVWDFERSREPLLKFFLFKEVQKNVLEDICLKAEKLGEFMAGVRVQIKKCASMVPLPGRTAGAVMSPLKGCQEFIAGGLDDIQEPGKSG